MPLIRYGGPSLWRAVTADKGRSIFPPTKRLYNVWRLFVCLCVLCLSFPLSVCLYLCLLATLRDKKLSYSSQKHA